MVSSKGGHMASIPVIYTSTTMKNHNRRTASERSVINYRRAKTRFIGTKPSTLASAVVQNIRST